METKSIKKLDIADADNVYGEADRMVTNYLVDNYSPPRVLSIVTKGARIQTGPKEAEATIH